MLNPAKVITGLATAGLREARNLPQEAGAIGSAVIHGQSPLEVQNYLPAHLQRQPGEGNVAYAQRISPLVGGTGSTIQQGGADIAGGAQGAAGALTGNTLHPLGEGFQHAAAQRFAAHPLGEALKVAGTVALGAGGLAGAAGAASGLLGADQAAAESGALAAAAGGSPEDLAAAQGNLAAASATPAARAAARLGQVSDVAGQVSHLANQAMTAPWAPYRFAAPRLLEAIQGTRVGAGLTNASRALTAIRENVTTPAAQAAANVSAGLRRTDAALGGDPEMWAAMNERMTGRADAILKPAATAGVDALHTVGADLGLSPRASELAAGFGTPEEEAALQEGMATRTGMNVARGSAYLTGAGRLRGAGNPEQFGTDPLAANFDEATIPARQAAHDAEQRLAAAHAAAGVPIEPLPDGALPVAQANASELARAMRLYQEGRGFIPGQGPVGGAAANEIAVDTARAHGLDSPEQIPNYLAHVRQASGAPAMPGAASELFSASRAAKAAQRAMDETVAKAELDPQNWPARFRPTLVEAPKAVSRLHDMADAADRVAPGGGDLMRQAAGEITTTVPQMIEAGIDPQHLIGPAAEEPGGLGVRPGKLLPQARKLSSEYTKEAATVPHTMAEVADTETRLARQQAINQGAVRLQERIGTTAGAEGLAGATVADAAKAGFAAWDPANWREQPPAGTVLEPGTPLIPRAVFEQFAHTFNQVASDKTSAVLGRAWDRAIMGGKIAGVAMAPSYMAAVAIADSIKAMALGGVGPVSFGQGILDAIRTIREEPENEVAVAVRGKGLSAEQAAEKVGIEQGGRLSALSQKAFAPTRYLQDVQRLGLAFAKLDQGASSEEAVATANRVMGDFTRLTPTEQSTIRRIIPGYAFYKHVTTLALTLPVDAPERLAWLNFLYQATGPIKPGGYGAYFGNPFGILGTVPSLAYPLRYATELAGIHTSSNSAKIGGLTSPTSAAHGPAPVFLHGPRALPEAGYLGAQLFPESKAALAAVQANVPRYQTGEPYKTGTPYPGGRLGGVQYALGLQPSTPAPPKLAAGGRGGRSSGRGGRRSGR